MRTIRHLLRRHCGNETGATLVIVAVCMSVLMPTALALSLELGTDTVVNRSLQAAADAGALDAARYINISPSAVQAEGAAAVQQNYPGASSTVTEGLWNNTANTFSTTCADVCNAVEVTASASVKHIAESGSATLSRSAIAAVNPTVPVPGTCTTSCVGQPPGCPPSCDGYAADSEFSIGTYLAAFNTQSAEALNTLLPALGTLSTVDISVLGYQGLVASSVTIQDLIDASGGLLTPQNVLSASSPALLTPGQWLAILDAATGAQVAADNLQCSATSQPSSSTPALCAAWESLTALDPPSLTEGTTCVPPSTTAPTVAAVSPDLGTTAGGTSVTVSGTNFTGATAVDFGATPATAFTVVDSSTITATTPAGSAGVVDVTVTTPDGTSSTGPADEYTYAGTATISSIAPAYGPVAGATSVTITGANLAGTTSVAFGGRAATSFTIVSSTTITAVSPSSPLAGNGAGPVNVTLTNGGTVTSPQQFTYVAAPTVGATGLNPLFGPVAGGTSVTITGTNFVTGDPPTVDFGANAATEVTVNSATSLTAVTPASTLGGNRAGAVSVSVTDAGGGPVTAAQQFTYEAAPTINATGISPAFGPAAGGTTVTITGTNFVSGDAPVVKFGTNAATGVHVVSSTQITAVTPAGASGAVAVAVTDSGGGPVTAAQQFTYGPTITSINVVSVTLLPPAATLQINGTGLASETSVTIGGNAATVTSATNTQIVAKSSGILTIVGGLVSVVVTTPYGSASGTVASSLLGGLTGIVHGAGTAAPVVLAADVVHHAAPIHDKVALVARGSAASVQRLSATTTPVGPRLIGLFQNSASVCLSLCQMVSINGSTCATTVPQTALAADVDLLDVLSAEAELANGQNAISLTPEVNVAGVTASLVADLVQPAQVGYGPPGTTISSEQVDAQLTLGITLPAGLGTVAVNVPITAADGTATYESTTCSGNTMTSTQILASTTAVQSAVTLDLLGTPVLISELTVNGASPTTLTFTSTPSSQNISAGGLSFSSVADDPTGAIATALNAVAANLPSVLQALGVSIAGAQVSDLATDCSPVQEVQ